MRYENNSFVYPGMGASFMFSLFLHLGALIFAYYGFPYIQHDSSEIVQSITVDVISEEEMKEELNESKEFKRPLPPKNVSEAPAPPPRPLPPKMTADAPPELAAPAPPELKEDISKPVTPSIPYPKARDIKRKPAPPKAKQQEFSSILKNLAPHAPEKAQPIAPLTTPAGPDEGSPLSRFSQQINSNEISILLGQLSRCWNIPAGAKYAENLVVELKITVNPDRTVSGVEVMNGENSDAFFKAASASAVRAVLSPQCSPLELPPNKYEQWKTIRVLFDPRKMLQ